MATAMGFFEAQIERAVVLAVKAMNRRAISSDTRVVGEVSKKFLMRISSIKTSCSSTT